MHTTLYLYQKTINSFNTEVYCEDTANVVAMYNWLKSDLAAYRAANPTGWIFAIGHRQMYLGTTGNFEFLTPPLICPISTQPSSYLITGAFDSYLQRYGFNCTNPATFRWDFLPALSF
jgi:hypothetical protein